MGGSEYWAECKCYSNNLSINDISPTILYAFIQNTGLLFIFSYTDLNPNAYHAIGSIKKTGLRIFPLAGDDLDNELKKYNQLLEKHFSISQNDLFESQKDKKYKIYSHISRDILTHTFDSNDNRCSSATSSEHDVFLNERFSIDLTINNSDDQVANFEVTIEDLANVSKYFNILDLDFLKTEKEIVSIGGKETGQLRLFIQLAAVAEYKTHTLRVLVKNTGDGTVKTIRIKIKCSWLLKSPLVGSTHDYLTQVIKPTLGNRNRRIVFNFYGRSGVGKTRMLSEVINELISHKINVLEFQGQQSKPLNFRDFFKQVVSRMENIPFLKHKKNAVLALTDSELSFPKKVLFDDSFRFDDDYDACLNYLIDVCKSESYSLVIDNVQFLEESIIKFLVLLTKVDSGNLRLLTIFAFNTDFMLPATGNEVKSFFELLKRASATRREEYHSYELTGFKDHQAHEYLYNILPSIKDFPKTAELLLETSEQGIYGNKEVSPLFLEQKLWHLKTEGALLDNGKELYFKDITIFNRALNELPRNIKDLFARRLESLKQNQKQQIVNILYLIFIFRNFPKNWISVFNFSEEDVNYLIQTGFIIRLHNIEYQLYHKQLELFFDELDFKGHTDIITTATGFIESDNLQNQYAVPYFFLEYDLSYNGSGFQSIAYLLTKFKNRNIDINVALRLSDKLFSVLISQKTPVNSAQEVELFIGCCEYIKTYRSFDSALTLFQKAFDKIMVLRIIRRSF